MSRRDFIATVGYGVPIRRRADGTILFGTRKFTPAEQIAYKRNMYGKNYFRRMGKINAKKLTPEQRHERAMKAVQTKLEKYTPAELKDITRRQVETRRKMPNYQQWLEEHRRAMNTPEARAKQRAAVRARWPKINENYHWVNRYFICDCEIDGHEFREGEWVRNTSPIYDKASTMQLVYPLNELPEDTKALAIERRTWYLNIRARCRKWFTKRPDVIYGILDGIMTT